MCVNNNDRSCFVPRVTALTIVYNLLAILLDPATQLSPELYSLLATLTGGPVGIGDRVGTSNRTIITRFSLFLIVSLSLFVCVYVQILAVCPTLRKVCRVTCFLLYTICVIFVSEYFNFVFNSYVTWAFCSTFWSAPRAHWTLTACQEKNHYTINLLYMIVFSK